MAKSIGRFFDAHTWVLVLLIMIALVGGGVVVFDWLPEQPAFKYMHPAISGTFTAFWGFVMIFGTYYTVGSFFDSESEYGKDHSPTRIGCLFVVLCAICIVVFVLPGMGNEEEGIPPKDISFSRRNINDFARLSIILLIPAWLGASAQIARNKNRQDQKTKDRLFEEVLFEESGLRRADIEAKTLERLDYIDYTGELHDAARAGDSVKMIRALSDGRICKSERNDPSWRYRYALWTTTKYGFSQLGATVRECAISNGIELPTNIDDLRV